MLKIFEQIFHRDSPRTRKYPDELIRRATERVVDATDPRVRMLSSYRRQLRTAVIHAIDHAIDLVDSFSEPVAMSGPDWGDQPMLGAMFASADSVRSTITGDAGCRDFVQSNPPAAQPVNALLVAKMSRRQTFGYDLVDDRMVADVPLTVISFDEHRLIGLAMQAVETRRLLQLRVFDYLATQALAEITEVRDHREDLVARRRLLKAKLDILSRSTGSLAQEPRQEDRIALQKKMDAVEAALSEAGADDTVLQRNLGIAVETLAHPEKQLWLELRTLYLDNLHYLRAAGDPRAVELHVQVLCDVHAHELAAMRVFLPPGSLNGG